MVIEKGGQWSVFWLGCLSRILKQFKQKIMSDYALGYVVIWMNYNAFPLDT